MHDLGVFGFLMLLKFQLLLQVFDLVEHAPDDLLHLLHIRFLHIDPLLQQVVYFEQFLELAQCVVIFFSADLSLIGLGCSPLAHFDRFAELPLLLYF